MESNSVCNHTSDINKIGRLWSGSPIYESRVWLQTQLDDTKPHNQLIINAEKFYRIAGRLVFFHTLTSYRTWFRGTQMQESIYHVVIYSSSLCASLCVIFYNQCTMSSASPQSLSIIHHLSNVLNLYEGNFPEKWPLDFITQIWVDNFGGHSVCFVPRVAEIQSKRSFICPV